MGIHLLCACVSQKPCDLERTRPADSKTFFTAPSEERILLGNRSIQEI